MESSRESFESDEGGDRKKRWRDRLRNLSRSSDDDEEQDRTSRMKSKMTQFLKGRIAPRLEPIKERVTQQFEDWKAKKASMSDTEMSDPFEGAPTVDEMVRVENERLLHFTELLTQPCVDLNALRAASRRGIPFDARAEVWKVLLGYLPCDYASRDSVLQKKREAYKRLVLSYIDVELDAPDRTPKRDLPFEDSDLMNDIFSVAKDEQARKKADLLGTLPPRLSKEERARRSVLDRKQSNGSIPHTLKHVLDIRKWGELCDQIHVDVIRTVPQGYQQLFLHPCLLNALARILFLFSVVHHNGNYWQGLNEIPVPFFITFLSFATHLYPAELNGIEDRKLQDVLFQSQVEADVYWCMCSFVNELQRHDFAIGANGSVTPKAMLSSMESVLKLTNPTVFTHLERHGLDLIFYAFRWMVCLLIREMPSLAIIRLWDTYIADPGTVTALHPCVCSALIHLHGQALLRLDSFEEILMYLQKLPTSSWTERETAFMVDIAIEYQHQMREVELEAQRSLEAVIIVILVVITVAIALDTEKRLEDRKRKKRIAEGDEAEVEAQAEAEA